jgi:hypothetical protein
MMARTAALSGAGSFAQAVTIRVRSGQERIEFRESIRESSADFPIKSGGERGIRTPETLFLRFQNFGFSVSFFVVTPHKNNFEHFE